MLGTLSPTAGETVRILAGQCEALINIDNNDTAVFFEPGSGIQEGPNYYIRFPSSGTLVNMFRIGTATAPDHHPEIPEHLNPELKELIESMFNLEYKKRPSAHLLRSDPYFDDRQVVPIKFESRDSFNSALARSISEAREGYTISAGKGEDCSELTEWGGATGEMPGYR